MPLATLPNISQRQGLTMELWLSWDYVDQAGRKHTKICLTLSAGIKGLCHYVCAACINLNRLWPPLAIPGVNFLLLLLGMNFFCSIFFPPEKVSLCNLGRNSNSQRSANLASWVLGLKSRATTLGSNFKLLHRMSFPGVKKKNPKTETILSFPHSFIYFWRSNDIQNPEWPVPKVLSLIMLSPSS